MKKVAETKPGKTDWAAHVRKYKPDLNQLTNVERQQLLSEALMDINGGKTATSHVRRR